MWKCIVTWIGLFKFKQPYAANSSILDTAQLEWKLLKDPSSVSCAISGIPWKVDQIWTAVLIRNLDDYDTYNKQCQSQPPYDKGPDLYSIEGLFSSSKPQSLKALTIH